MSDPDLSTPQARRAYALESHRMALELYDLVFLPWRWGKWWKQSREVKRRIAVLRKALGE